MRLLLQLHDLALQGLIQRPGGGTDAGLGEVLGVVRGGRAVFDGGGDGEQELAVVQHR